ncbi:HAD family acid phosphatase [Streptomyces sp. HNM0574]|uniref:HAD family acid phosphatase n=1 Tax=Streptomyces sp. HNM0574 TaxID=2714954 RepID=UPI00146B4E81|nr:HAD family acid phosphatase [Streptomyces sp. HNM0574]NLU69151.1 acid phosphatase [Streptomyces sp. HNM0574]
MSPRTSRRPLSALPRRGRIAAVGVAAVLAGGGLFGAGQATAGNAVPATDREIPNLDTVKDRIEAYYGDVETGDGEHHASPRSNYAKQVRGIADRARTELAGELAARGEKRDDRPAIVLDVDDTTLLTYNFERRVDYAFSDEAQDEYLRTTDMPAVFGMPELVNWAHDKGVEVFFLTGRKEHQRDWSVRNLKNAGYEVPTDRGHFFLKDEKNPPPYLECGTDCTTVEYKSGTRAHIESGGYDIVGSFGDQHSDLRGGHAERTYKLPNPMYYLP